MKRKREAFVKVFKKLSWFLLISGLGLILACRSWSQIQVPGLGHDRYGTYRPVRLVLVQYWLPWYGIDYLDIHALYSFNYSPNFVFHFYIHNILQCIGLFNIHLILFLTKEGGEEKPSKRVLSIFNMLPHWRPNANVPLERSYSFPRWTCGYSSDEEDIDKKGPSSVRSVPLTRHSPHLVLDVGSDAAIARLRPFIFEIPKSRSDSSSLQEVNQNQANNSKCPFFYLLYACSYTNKMTHI